MSKINDRNEDCPVCDDVQTVQEVDTGYYHRSSPGLDSPPCIPVLSNGWFFWGMTGD